MLIQKVSLIQVIFFIQDSDVLQNNKNCETNVIENR